MEDAVDTIPLTGFDPEGEPTVRRTAAGRLWLGFEFMPPSWGADDDFADFDAQLQRALGVPVVWEDREWFRIDRPAGDTVEKICRFLAAVRGRLDPGASGR